MRKLIAILILALTAPASAEVIRYEIAPDQGSEIVFESKAPLDSFKGRTRSIRGWFVADLDALGDSVALEVEVDPIKIQAIQF